jgi:hypothetical protein
MQQTAGEYVQDLGVNVRGCAGASSKPIKQMQKQNKARKWKEIQIRIEK